MLLRSHPSVLAPIAVLASIVVLPAHASGQRPPQSPTHPQPQRAIEISEDGRQTIAVPPTTADEGGLAGGGSRGAGHPFGTAPDWFNDLRRPVGGLQIADMNGDGHNDLVVGCFISSGCCPPYDDFRNLIYYNTGAALEAQPSWFSADEVHTGDIQVADINNDTFPDILSVNGGFAHSNSVIYYGSATGPDNVPDVTLNNPQSSWNLAAAVFDFDHDLDLDIVITNQSGIPDDNFRPLYLYRNDAGVIETTPFWQSADAMISNGVGVGDYDNDGWEDIAVAKWVNFECAIYRSVNGTLQTSPVWTTGDNDGARGALFGDIDGNGWQDVIFGYDPTRLYSNTNGTLTSTWESAAPFPSAQDMKLLDIDGDGDLDLGETHFSTGRTHIYLNEGGGGGLPTAPSWTFDAPEVGNALAFGDINGDGTLDLAIGYSGDVSVRVFYGIPQVLCPADVDDSGAVDVDDLVAVILGWGPCADPENCPGDVNGTDAVDVDDLVAVILAWGPCE